MNVKLKYLKKCVMEQSAVRMNQEENMIEVGEMKCIKSICAHIGLTDSNSRVVAQNTSNVKY